MGFLDQCETETKQGYKENVLTKVLDKAKGGGWYPNLTNSIKWYADTGHYRTIIFDTDFAKAFFGNEYYEYEMLPDSFHCTRLQAWQHHLRKMVICEEPLTYLREFVS